MSTLNSADFFSGPVKGILKFNPLPIPFRIQVHCANSQVLPGYLICK